MSKADEERIERIRQIFTDDGFGADLDVDEEIQKEFDSIREEASEVEWAAYRRGVEEAAGVLFPMTSWAGSMPGEVHEQYAKRIQELILDLLGPR